MGVQTIVAPGMISFQVITPDSLLSSINGTPSILTLAFPVIVTVPVLIVNAFARPESMTAVPETVTSPVAKTNGFFKPESISAVVVKVTVPVPKYNRSAPQVSVTEVTS